MSEIKPKENFICNNDIINSIFKEKQTDFDNYDSIFNVTKIKDNLNVGSDDISDFYFQVAFKLNRKL